MIRRAHLVLSCPHDLALILHDYDFTETYLLPASFLVDMASPPPASLWTLCGAFSFSLSVPQSTISAAAHVAKEVECAMDANSPYYSKKDDYLGKARQLVFNLKKNDQLRLDIDT